jgi:3-dehydroquinate synthase
LLETLPAPEIRNGLAEVIKFGMVLDAALFDYVEKHGTHPDNRFFTHIVTAAARLKAMVVARDERETEYRKIFNYGHTIGHAIELVSSHAIPHGEAVAIGMSYEAWIACRLGYLSEADRRRQDSLLREVGLPTTTDCSATKLIETMRRDKKNQGQNIFFVLPKAIGEVHAQGAQIAFPVPEKIIAQALKPSPN